jgi:hypothetical protein
MRNRHNASSPGFEKDFAVADVQTELKSIEKKLYDVEDELAKTQTDDDADIILDLRSSKSKTNPSRPPSLQLALAYMVTIAISAAVCTLGMLAYCNAWPFTLLFNEPASVVELVQGYAMSDRFAGNLIYSIIVPDSLALSAAISEGATYSGWVIGIYKGLAWAGLGVGMLMCCIRNKHWMRNMWYCIFAGKLMALVGSVMFLLIVIYRDSVPNARMWLLSSRSIAGIGVGIVVLPIELVFVHTTTASERPLLLSKAVFNVTLGIGLGPLVASTTRALHEFVCGSDYGAMEAVMCWPVMVSLVSFAAVFYLPGAEDYIDTESEDFQGIQEKAADDGARLGFIEEPDFAHRRVGIVTCAMIIGLRGVIVSGLEAATAMILERDYGISKNMVGLAIGLTFLVSVPARLMFGISKDWFTIREWIRLTMCLSFLGSIFLFRAVERFVSREASTPAILLLAADSLLYCSIYQVSGLVEGVMTTFALPSGSIFTVDNVIVLKILCLDCIGRLLGPPFARMQVEAGGPENGQDGYAWQQLSMTLMATLLTEAVLLRVMERVSKHEGRKYGKKLSKEGADDTDIPHGEIKSVR